MLAVGTSLCCTCSVSKFCSSVQTFFPSYESLNILFLHQCTVPHPPPPGPLLCTNTLTGTSLNNSLVAFLSPCTGIVTVCPLLAVTVAVATVTSVWPGTGVTDIASGFMFCTGTVFTTGCWETLTGVPLSEVLSLSTNSLLLVGLAVGELYLSYRVVGEDERPVN